MSCDALRCLISYLFLTCLSVLLFLSRLLCCLELNTRMTCSFCPLGLLCASPGQFCRVGILWYNLCFTSALPNCINFLCVDLAGFLHFRRVASRATRHLPVILFVRVIFLAACVSSIRLRHSGRDFCEVHCGYVQTHIILILSDDRQ